MNHARTLVTVAALSSLGLVPAAAQRAAAPGAASRLPFVQVEGGTLNPGELFQVTMAYGLGAGLDLGRYSLVAHALRQSQNRNSGPDLSKDARTFLTVALERRFGTPRGWPLRQGFLRLDLGVLFRSPFRAAPVTGIGLGWRQSLTKHLRLVGTLYDHLAWVARETFSCEPLWPDISATCVTARGPQHNFGGVVAFQLHR